MAVHVHRYYYLYNRPLAPEGVRPKTDSENECTLTFASCGYDPRRHPFFFATTRPAFKTFKFHIQYSVVSAVRLNTFGSSRSWCPSPGDVFENFKLVQEYTLWQAHSDQRSANPRHLNIILYIIAGHRQACMLCLI